jgi:hypothetical protein
MGSSAGMASGTSTGGNASSPGSFGQSPQFGGGFGSPFGGGMGSPFYGGGFGSPGNLSRRGFHGEMGRPFYGGGYDMYPRRMAAPAVMPNTPMETTFDLKPEQEAQLRQQQAFPSAMLSTPEGQQSYGQPAAFLGHAPQGSGQMLGGIGRPFGGDLPHSSRLKLTHDLTPEEMQHYYPHRQQQQQQQQQMMLQSPALSSTDLDRMGWNSGTGNFNRPPPPQQQFQNPFQFLQGYQQQFQPQFQNPFQFQQQFRPQFQPQFQQQMNPYVNQSYFQNQMMPAVQPQFGRQFQQPMFKQGGSVDDGIASLLKK